MKRLRIDKHRSGFCIQLSQNVFFYIDINDWHFVPSIEFHRAAGLRHIFVFAFLCFELSISRWRFEK